MPSQSPPDRDIKIKKKSHPRNALRRVYERFIRIRGQPREIALGFALGLFIGMTPTMGIQMPIAVFFAALLKWSKISAAFGVWVTNPLTAPVIYAVTYFVGASVLGLETNMMTRRGVDLECCQGYARECTEIFRCADTGWHSAWIAAGRFGILLGSCGCKPLSAKDQRKNGGPKGPLAGHPAKSRK